MWHWLDTPSPSWAQTLTTLAGNIWLPVLTLFAGALGTWYKLTRDRKDEHARWRRDELTKVALEAAKLGGTKYKIIYEWKEIDFGTTQKQKDVGFMDLQSLPDYRLVMDGLSEASEKARILSAPDLAYAIAELGKVKSNHTSAEGYEAALAAMMAARVKVESLSAHIIKIA